jgi:hypothetical protein
VWNTALEQLLQIAELLVYPLDRGRLETFSRLRLSVRTSSENVSTRRSVSTSAFARA